MPNSQPTENDFLRKITEIIEDNISNEQFGVSELADGIGMSRSNLLRKVKSSTNLSVSQFINQVRLKKAMEMLKDSSLRVSEISYQVGFSSPSYFIKCFRDHYGYPPGEAGKRESSEGEVIEKIEPTRKRIIIVIGLAILLIVILTILFIVFKPALSPKANLEKSIAVLPFKNDSNDSTNVYLINGLMESILSNLQKVGELKVISRTSVEKYRNNTKTIPELAKELNVNYFIEGSGQKIGDNILLHIQLIEGSTDRHLWAEQYNREAKDIFSLQRDVAKNIADKIKVIITPEEEIRINHIPTQNLVAYDYFLVGLELFHKGDSESIQKAIIYFKKAIVEDNEFARAYADVAIAYYFLDAYQTEKQYSVEINNYADKALLLDSKLPQSLIAKALDYMHSGENELAIPYLEKALEYNPNSALVINILSDFYTNYVPNTEKYLEYALKGISLDIASHDSVTASYIFLHVSNAFIQTGFIDEALKYINKSLEYNQNNLYSQYVKAFILYARDRNLLQTKERLIEVLSKDSTRLDIIQEVAKICYYLGDFECAYKYYSKFNAIRDALNLDIYRYENNKIAVVLSQVGLIDESKKYLKDYKNYAENDKSIYQQLSLATYYSYSGDTEKAIEHLKLFSQQDNYHYWTIIFLNIDPLMDNIKDLPEYKQIIGEIETKFWNGHNQIKISLEDKGLL